MTRRFLLPIASVSLLVPGPTAAEFVRDVTGIEVRDDSGIMDQPWSGGFLTPQPRLVDIDADGDLDLLLLQEGTGIQLFRNTGNAVSARFELESEALGGIRPQFWYALTDIDADGDLDIFTDGNSVRWFRNDGTARDGRWTLVDESYQGIENKGIFNTPAFADIDGDGDVDYLEMEQLFGTARLYRNEGTLQRPHFVFETETFGCIDTFDPNAATKAARHGVSALTVGDIDRDGDLDVFVGDRNSTNLWFFRNDPAVEVCFTRVAQEFLPFDTEGFNQAVLGDLDGDLDADLVVGCRERTEMVANLFYLENRGTPSSPDHQAADAPMFRSIDVGRNSHPTAGDLDGDGDRDLLLGGDLGTVTILENIGTATAPAFDVEGLVQNSAQTVIQVGETSAPTLADTDGDGDLDLFVGNREGRVRFFRNVGDTRVPTFEEQDSQVAGLDADRFAAPAAGDLDDDGDVDLIVGEFGITENPRLWLVVNVGESGAPQWEIESDNVGVGDRFVEGDFESELTPHLVDVDDDGDLDLLLGERAGNVNLYRNQGTPASFDFQLETETFASADAGEAAVPCALDIENDGDLDLLVGTRRGGLQFYRFDADAGPAGPAPGDVVTLRPNPAKAETTLSFEVFRAGRVQLRLYDARGRHVATPLDRELSTGPFDAPWDGRDDRGRRLAASVFFFELEMNGQTARGKLTLLP